MVFSHFIFNSNQKKVNMEALLLKFVGDFFPLLYANHSSFPNSNTSRMMYYIPKCMGKIHISSTHF